MTFNAIDIVNTNVASFSASEIVPYFDINANLAIAVSYPSYPLLGNRVRIWMLTNPNSRL